MFNRLTGADVMAKDMLFATLDPTMRAVRLPDAGAGAQGRKVILSDTVGFISDLPTELVAAFRATLEEVLAADLILHVRDISHPETEEQAEDVAEILGSLGVDEDVDLIEVWNKIDALSADTRAALRRTDARTQGVQAVSALSGEGLDDLIAAIAGEDDPARLAHIDEVDIVERGTGAEALHLSVEPVDVEPGLLVGRDDQAVGGRCGIAPDRRIVGSVLFGGDHRLGFRDREDRDRRIARRGEVHRPRESSSRPPSPGQIGAK